MKVKLTPKTEVYDFCEPYIISELASNHNGDMKLAKKMIEKSKDAGADCVKFQSWSKATIFSKKVYEDNRFLSDDYRNRKDFTLEQIVDKYAIKEGDLLEMRRIAGDLGMDCISTPFSKGEVDFLVEKMKAPFIKVASMDLNNYPFLDYISRKGIPVALSVGFGSLSEIDTAVRTIEEAGNKQLVLLHCIAEYPPAPEKINLNRMDTLRSLYGYPVGFSDHSIGTAVALASTAKGACVIEKHFTLDKNMAGWDHRVSADFNELKEICQSSKTINKALGSGRIFQVESNERKAAFRRSIVTSRSIRAGETIREDDLDFKRPGTGLEPDSIRFIVGKSAKRNIPADEMIKLGDF